MICRVPLLTDGGYLLETVGAGLVPAQKGDHSGRKTSDVRPTL